MTYNVGTIEWEQIIGHNIKRNRSAKNLNGFDNNKKMFTWQPHGAQTTLNDVAIPQNASVIDIGDSKKLSKEDILTLAEWSDEKFKVHSLK